MNKQKLSYAFQCDEDEIMEDEKFYAIPFESSFPDDWVFDEYEITQQDYQGVFCWVVNK